jgi:hypothetical protein
MGPFDWAKGKDVKVFFKDPDSNEQRLIVETQGVIIEKSRSVGMTECLKRETINEAIQGKPGDCPLCDAGVPRRPLGARISGIGGTMFNRDALMKMLGLDYSLAQPWDMRVSTKGIPTRCYKMTKNKRIRKKWAKRYGLPKNTLYRDCTLIGESRRIPETIDQIMSFKYQD